MNFAKKAWIVLVISTILLSACGAATDTPADPNLFMTEGVGTMVAAFFETQTAMVPPSTNTAIPSSTSTPYSIPSPLPSMPALSTATATLFYYTPTLGSPTPTGTYYTSTPNGASLAYGCNNLVFIRDVNIPSGTVVRPGQGFIKTWKVQNTGTCNWMYQYALQPVGDAMGGGRTPIQRMVTPWDWAEVSVDLTAPRSPGTYTSYWRLADADGHMFGATLAVTIKVSTEPTATPIPPSSTFTNTPEPTSTYTNTPETPTGP